MSLEELFNSAVLDVAVPDTSLEYPPHGDTDDWLSRLTSGTADRTQAYFDEQLQFFLVIRIDHPTPNDPVNVDQPPPDLLKFLSHLQISLEATYISSTPVAPLDTSKSTRASLNPSQRTTSFGQAKLHDGLHPSIFPPPTPNPTPSTADNDRRYIRSEGTLLLAKIWGQDPAEDSRDAFSLFWSQKDRLWVALYRLSITVSFLRLNITKPLLCLTVSSTLREKPMTLTPTKHPLASFLATKGNLLPVSEEPASPTTANSAHVANEVPDGLNGFEEVNLLEGLASGPTFSSSGSDRIHLSTTRLGGVTRRRLFSLPAVIPTIAPTPSPAPSTARTAHATLRKSFRKTLRTVSGFRVRMRTVFVPYVLLPEADDDNDKAECLGEEEEEDERERREAGNDERTVVLCVEIENSGESGRKVGFAVEAVDVKVGGEGAKVTLIGWEDGGVADANKNRFPLLINAMEQYNLLYAVSFQHPPGDVDGFSLTRDSGLGDRPGGPSSADLQRAVTINIHGKPFLHSGAHHRMSGALTDTNVDVLTNSGTVSLPTQTFSSRWNCVLDLSSNQNRELAELLEADGEDGLGNNVLPEPASPFPTFSPRTASALGVGNSAFPFTLATASSQAVAGSRRRTTLFEVPPTGYSSMSSLTPTPSRPMSFLPSSSKQPPPATSKLGLNPPVIAQYPSTPTPATTATTTNTATTMTTTYGPPPTARSDGSDGGFAPQSATTAAYDYSYSSSKPPPPPPPLTPAYPAYPPNSALPPTPVSLGPIANQAGSVGPSVEIRRERGMVVGSSSALGSASVSVAVVPQTPGPMVPFGGDQVRYYRGDGNENGNENGNGNGNGNGQEGGQSVVVSIGLLGANSGAIYPLDRFTLDIFVFNQSARTRRFEVSYPVRRRRRRERQRLEGRDSASQKKKARSGIPPLGILPLDNRIRIGPLLPATCQSVRMQFLALIPGMHTIDMLTLTDVESGYSMNLRSVLDVVVHQRA